MTDPELIEIRQAFAIEGSELLADMESALLALEVNHGAEADFNRLFRVVHTIKGSASIVRFEEVEIFCHSIENILASIREHEQSLDLRLVTLLLKCHDHISAMMEQYSVSGDIEDAFVFPPMHALLLEQLKEWATDEYEAETNKCKYGLLDENYLDSEYESGDGGFRFFEEEDDAAGPPQKESPGESVFAPEKSLRSQQIVRVDAARIDQLSDLVVELVTASSVMEANVRHLRDLASTESAAHVTDLIKQIQEKTMSFRMIPVQSLFQRFQRIIHDIASSTGKQIRLQISGGETELDKAVAEKLHEPLLHLVRNAIDHGIEMPDERILHGKKSSGVIHLNAFHDAGNIVIRVGDDGQGIDLESVANRVVERGLARRDAIVADKSLLSYIFEPGFSTLKEATMLSGRGVGMDVVRKVVESIRGRIDIETDQGVGTTFQITIPLSLSLVDGFMVSLGSNLYILSMDLVLETIELPSAESRATMPNGCLQIRDRLLPCLDLRKLLGVKEPTPPIQHVVVFRHGGTPVGLIVDRLQGEIKTVIKPLGHLFRNVTCISGASILGDGSIALLLETAKLVEVSGGMSHFVQ